MISPEYKEILLKINGLENFGKRSSCPKYLEKFIEKISPVSILDYGCGTGRLIATLEERFPKIQIDGFDPGNISFQDFKKEKYDLIISTDVLEHVEPEHIDETLNFLKQRSRYFYHLIALQPSRVILPDGRNAHLILESAEWWKNKFQALGCQIMLNQRMTHEKRDRITQEKKIVDKFFIGGKN